MTWADLEAEVIVDGLTNYDVRVIFGCCRPPLPKPYVGLTKVAATPVALTRTWINVHGSHSNCPLLQCRGWGSKHRSLVCGRYVFDCDVNQRRLLNQVQGATQSLFFGLSIGSSVYTWEVSSQSHDRRADLLQHGAWLQQLQQRDGVAFGTVGRVDTIRKEDWGTA